MVRPGVTDGGAARKGRGLGALSYLTHIARVLPEALRLSMATEALA
jgi:hypothetical protein